MTRWFRRARHGKGSWDCGAYFRHWHIGPFIVWSR